MTEFNYVIVFEAEDAEEAASLIEGFDAVLEKTPRKNSRTWGEVTKRTVDLPDLPK